MQLESTLPSLILKAQDLQRRQHRAQRIRAQVGQAQLHEVTPTTGARALLDGTCLGLRVACVGRTLHLEALHFVVQEVERCCNALSDQGCSHSQLPAPHHSVGSLQLHSLAVSGANPGSPSKRLLEPLSTGEPLALARGGHTPGLSPIAAVRRCQAALQYVTEPWQQAGSVHEADGHRFLRGLQLGQLEWCSHRLQTVAKALLAEPLASCVKTEGCNGQEKPLEQLQAAWQALETVQQEAELLQLELMELVQKMLTLQLRFQQKYLELCFNSTSSDVQTQPPHSHQLEALTRFA